jgi:hypothetical protein
MRCSDWHVTVKVSWEVVSTVRYLRQRAGFPISESLRILGLPRAGDFRWTASDGKTSRPQSVVPRGHCLLPEERNAIVAFLSADGQVGYDDA